MTEHYLASQDDLATRQFRVFIELLMVARRRMAVMSDNVPDEAFAPTVGELPLHDERNARACAAEMQRHLLHLLEMQALEIQRESSRYERELHAQARYIKVVLADELLLNSNWYGQSCWDAFLLESVLFRSNVAGEKVFEDIDALLRSRDESNRTLSRLYLFTLGLGFQGRYRMGSAENELASTLRGYREALYELIYQRRADLSAGGERVLVPRAYANTPGHIAPCRLRTNTYWLARFGMGLLVMLALSEVLWVWQSWPVRQALSVDVVRAAAR